MKIKEELKKSNLNYSNTTESILQNWDKNAQNHAQRRRPQRQETQIFRGQALEIKKKVEIVKTKCDRRSLWKFSWFYLELQLWEPANSTHKQPKQPQRRKEHKTVSPIAAKSVYFSELFDQIWNPRASRFVFLFLFFILIDHSGVTKIFLQRVQKSTTSNSSSLCPTAFNYQSLCIESP